MNRVIHFEIHADHPGRAIKFYSGIFGWKINEWDANQPIDYWLITTGPKSSGNINGAITKRSIPVTNDNIIAYVCTIEVENLDEMIEKVKSNSGQIINDKMEIPNIGWMVYAKDTEGNMFGLMQSMPGAMENM